jgi:hypothetical protein
MNPLDSETILIRLNPGPHWILLVIMIKHRGIMIVDSQNFDLVDENFRDQEIVKRKEAVDKIVIGVKKWLLSKELDGFEALHAEVSKYKTPQLIIP